MWDDIIIGNNSKIEKGLTGALSCFETKDQKTDISENSESYWITHWFVDVKEIGLTIFKDTDEGKQLNKLLNDTIERKDLRIKVFLDNIIIKNTKPAKLKSLFCQIYQQGIKDGRNQKIQELLEVLKIKQ